MLSYTNWLKDIKGLSPGELRNLNGAKAIALRKEYNHWVEVQKTKNGRA